MPRVARSSVQRFRSPHPRAVAACLAPAAVPLAVPRTAAGQRVSPPLAAPAPAPPPADTTRVLLSVLGAIRRGQGHDITPAAPAADAPDPTAVWYIRDDDANAARLAAGCGRHGRGHVSCAPRTSPATRRAAEARGDVVGALTTARIAFSGDSAVVRVRRACVHAPWAVSPVLPTPRGPYTAIDGDISVLARRGAGWAWVLTIESAIY